MSARTHKSDVFIVVAAGVAVVVVALALVVLGISRQRREGGLWVRSAISTNVEGVLIWRTLLERLGFSTVISDRLLTEEALQKADALYILDPVVPVREHERSALREWVEGGGVLVCADTWDGSLAPLHGLGGGARSCCGTGCEVTASKPEGDLPLSDGVDGTVFGSPCTLDLPEEEDVSVLFRDESGVRIASKRLGDGRVVVLADTSFLSNRRIGDADNAVLAVNLAAHARSHASGDRLVFDEYHFGYGRRETGWPILGSLLVSTSAGWGVLSLTLAGLLWLFYAGRRFGPRRTPRRSRRSRLEYVRAVGEAFRSAGAHRLVCALICRRFKARVARLVGLPSTAPTDEIASRLARRTGADVLRYRSRLRRCDAVGENGKVSARQASALLKELSRMEREVFHGSG